MKEALRSSEAQKDVEGIVSYYSKQSLSVSNRFIDEYQAAIREIERMPGIGSLRFAYTLDIANVRSLALHDFPYLIFYFEREDHIDVARVLHSHQDIFNLLLGID